MKKLLLLSACSLLLFTGCGEKKEKNNWETQFQASTFTVKKGAMIKVSGSIKNISPFLLTLNFALPCFNRLINFTISGLN